VESALFVAAVAAVAVAATNLDNLLILVTVLTRADQSFGHVVAGTLLASLGMLGLCGLGALLADFAPTRWLGYLGLVPIGLGLREFYRMARFNSERAAEEPPGSRPSSAAISSLGVAGLMLANGADSFGALLPIVAESRISVLPAIAAAVVATNLGVCWAARGIAGHPAIGPRIRRIGPKLVPFVLIAVGSYVLADTRSDSFVGEFEARPTNELEGASKLERERCLHGLLVGPAVVLWQIITDFEPGSLRTHELMETRRAFHIAIDSTHGEVEHIGSCLEVHYDRRSAVVTENTVRPVRVGIDLQMILPRENLELVAGNFTPSCECSSMDSPAYRTMAMAEFL
jgi:cadmium resistance protein CadD (predicted permease)